MSKFRKMSLEALEKEYDKVDKLHNEIILHKRYKNCEKLVVIPKEMQKFKKYPPVTINYVYVKSQESPRVSTVGGIV